MRVITDTSTLWTIDGTAHDYPDWRAKECLLELVDAILDPTNHVRCFFQTPDLARSPELQKLPESYRALTQRGLLRPEKRASAKAFEHELTTEALTELLAVVERWWNANPDYARSLLALHRHPRLVDPVRYRAMSEDGRSDSIPPMTYEFCMRHGGATARRVEANHHCLEMDFYFLFAIIARGHQYECAAAHAYSSGARYLTHPARSLPGCTQLSRSLSVPRAVVPLSSIVVASWERRPEKSLQDLFDTVASVRERAATVPDLWAGRITTEAALTEAIREVVAPVLPARINEEWARRITTAAASAIGSIIGVVAGSDVTTTGLLGAFAGSLEWILQPFTSLVRAVNLPPSVADQPLVRSIVYYPTNELGYTYCRRCRTENMQTPCPVCGFSGVG